ncbi:hypothetical protein C0J52_19932 [Blattella germanica]|nr:hypothetical protein C0J52_19932 [Blattella germanica]
MTAEKWKSVVAHTWKIMQQSREANGVLETQAEQLIIITLNAVDSSDEADVDIYKDCGVFPLD